MNRYYANSLQKLSEAIDVFNGEKQITHPDYIVAPDEVAAIVKYAGINPSRNQSGTFGSRARRTT